MDATGKLVLRLMVGGMMLFHGITKALGGIGFIQEMVVAQGLPQMVAYGVYVGEIVAPIFIIFGWQSRIFAGVVAINMAVAIYLTKMDAILSLGEHGGWAIELPMFYLLGAVSIVLLGSGRYAIVED